MDVLLAAAFVLLHRVDGGEVFVNPAQITALNARTAAPNKHLIEQAQCAVGLSNGRMVSVLESCEQVKQLLDAAAK